jgi:hypothetical protein
MGEDVRHVKDGWFREGGNVSGIQQQRGKEQRKDTRHDLLYL